MGSAYAVEFNAASDFSADVDLRVKESREDRFSWSGAV
jgi:hypothetical protein